MGMLLLSVLISMTVVCCISKLSRAAARMGWICGLAVVSLIVAMTLDSRALLIQGLLNLVFAVGFASYELLLEGRVPAKGVTWCGVGVCLVVYVPFLFVRVPEVIANEKLRRQYPFESISHRLAYEQRPVPAFVGNQPTLVSHELSENVQSRLRGFEENFAYANYRGDSLKALHNGTAHQFVLSPGFGRSRVPGRSRGGVELPDSVPIPLPNVPAASEAKTDDPGLVSSLQLAPDAVADNPLPAGSVLFALHDRGLYDFLEPNRMGFFRDREHVSGFRSHEFSGMPTQPVARQRQEPAFDFPANWQLVRLELVSLLTHDTPVAYLSKNLPRMEELRDGVTRPLDAFEQQALAQLQGEQDVVYDETSSRIRMLGSLRASTTCLDCHSVKRGDLLGAFTYELLPNATPHSEASSQEP